MLKIGCTIEDEEYGKFSRNMSGVSLELIDTGSNTGMDLKNSRNEYSTGSLTYDSYSEEFRTFTDSQIPPPPSPMSSFLGGSATCLPKIHNGIPPPPPPPLIHGFPAPPPPPLPPLGTSKFSTFSRPYSSPVVPKLPHQRTPEPRNLLKKLQWNKIPENLVMKSTNLWTVSAKLFNKRTLNFSRLEDLFSVGSPVASIDGISGSKSGDLNGDPKGSTVGTLSDRRKKANEITLIDPKRSMNINIFLRQFRVPHADIVDWLRRGCSEKFGAERLRGFIQILPEPEEIEKLREFSGDFNRLGNAEKFYLELLKLPNYRLLTECLLVKEDFHHLVDYINPAVDSIILSAKDIKESKALHEIIYMVLIAGNFLNSGAYAGNAAGFKLSSLLKLTEIRSHNPSVNLMHFVAQEAESVNPSLSEELTKMKYLSEASQYSQEGLNSDVKAFQVRLRGISQQLEIADAGFRLQMGPFIEAARTEMSLVEEDLDKLEEIRLDLSRYFCEDEKLFQLDDCIGVFNTFTKNFLKAIRENTERKEQEAKAEERKLQRQNTLRKSDRPSSAKSSKTSSSSSSSSSGSTSTESNPLQSQDRTPMVLARKFSAPIAAESDTPDDFNTRRRHSLICESSLNHSDDDLLNSLLKTAQGDLERKNGSIRRKRRTSRATIDTLERELLHTTIQSENGGIMMSNTIPDVEIKERRSSSLTRGMPRSASATSADAVFDGGMVAGSCRLSREDLREATQKERDERRRERCRRSRLESQNKLLAEYSLIAGNDCNEIPINSADNISYSNISSLTVNKGVSSISNATKINYKDDTLDRFRMGCEQIAESLVKCSNSLAVGNSKQFESNTQNDCNNESNVSKINSKTGFMNSGKSLTERAFIEHNLGKWRNDSSPEQLDEYCMREYTSDKMQQENERCNSVKNEEIENCLSKENNGVRSYKRWGRVFDKNAANDFDMPAAEIHDDTIDHTLARRYTLPAALLSFQGSTQVSNSSSDERTMSRKEKLRKLSERYSEITIGDGYMNQMEANETIYEINDPKSETESIYSAKDEGFESEGVSNPSISQRNSLNSALEMDIRLTPLLARKEFESENNNPADSQSTTSLFARSIDSLVAKNELTLCEASLDIDNENVEVKMRQSSSSANLNTDTASETPGRKTFSLIMESGNQSGMKSEKSGMEKKPQASALSNLLGKVSEKAMLLGKSASGKKDVKAVSSKSVPVSRVSQRNAINTTTIVSNSKSKNLPKNTDNKVKREGKGVSTVSSQGNTSQSASINRSTRQPIPASDSIIKKSSAMGSSRLTTPVNKGVSPAANTIPKTEMAKLANKPAAKTAELNKVTKPVTNSTAKILKTSTATLKTATSKQTADTGPPAPPTRTTSIRSGISARVTPQSSTQSARVASAKSTISSSRPASAVKNSATVASQNSSKESTPILEMAGQNRISDASSVRTLQPSPSPSPSPSLNNTITTPQAADSRESSPNKSITSTQQFGLTGSLKLTSKQVVKTPSSFSNNLTRQSVLGSKGRIQSANSATNPRLQGSSTVTASRKDQNKMQTFGEGKTTSVSADKRISVRSNPAQARHAVEGATVASKNIISTNLDNSELTPVEVTGSRLNPKAVNKVQNRVNSRLMVNSKVSLTSKQKTTANPK